MAGSVFSQYLPDMTDMNEIEKMMVFQYNKKSPAIGVILSILLPSAGHAYAGNWREGLFFTATQIVAFPIIPTTVCVVEQETCSIIAPTMLGTMLVIRIWEIIDAGKEVKRYNNKVYRKIFDRGPPSLSMHLQPTYQGANLTMSYSFN